MQAHQAAEYDISVQSAREQEWARRKKKIEEEQSKANSTSWYVLTWSYCIGMCTGIQQAFQSINIIKMFYPDNPGSKEIFKNVGFSILPSIIKFASPIALGMSWINAGYAIHRFAKTENKNIWAYSNLIFSCAAPVIWTSLFIAGAAVTAVALAPILPWVAIGVFAAYAAHGVFNCITNCYRAWKAHRKGNTNERNEYLKQAGKNLIGIVFNVLALTVSVVLGIKMSEASSKISDAIDYFKKTWKRDKLDAVMGSISSIFKTGCNLVTALTATAVVGVLANNARRIAQLNIETGKAMWNMIRHPINTAKECLNALIKRPFTTLGKALVETVKLPLRVAALVFTPVQALFAGTKSLYNWLTSKPKNTVSTQATTPVTSAAKSDELTAKNKTASTTKMIEDNLQKEAQNKELANQLESYDDKMRKKIMGYDKLIQDKYDNNMNAVPDKIKAKRMLLKQLHLNPRGESVDKIVASVKNNVRTGKGGELDFNGNQVFNSFFKQKGEVEKLTETARTIETALNKVAPAA